MNLRELSAPLTRRLDPVVTPIAQLVTRLTFGQAFAVTGWGKLTHLDKITQFFESLGIPFASLQAPMVATFEFVGGLLLLLGLGTRVAGLVLTSTMLVALVTAERGGIGSALTLADTFANVAPIPFLVATLWLVAKGPGALSLDALLARRAATAAAAELSPHTAA